MNYFFSKSIKVEDSVRIIATELVNEAVIECRADLITPQEIIHSVRKKCKRIRALLRIVRPEIEEMYKQENIFFRDIARKLSVIRDKHAVVETLIKLRDLKKYNSLKEVLNNLITELTQEENIRDTLDLINEFEVGISGSITRIKNWKVDRDGFQALKGGLKKTYRRGRIAMERTLNTPTDDNFHEWRKRVKYHYYHLELLTPVWNNIIKEYVNEAHSLSEILGYLHDLNVLSELIRKNPHLVKDRKILEKILDSIKTEEENLKLKSQFLGQRIFTEKPSVLVQRFEKWWNIWQNEEIQDKKNRLTYNFKFNL